MMKARRQEKILEIIGQRYIDTQQMLAEALKDAGFNSTQATISRDIRELNLIKEMGPDGIYRYVASPSGQTAGQSSKMRTIFKEGVTSAATAANLVVIRTLPGMASAACGSIDAMGLRDCVGTIAGDDTGFIAMSDNAAAEILCGDILEMIGG